MGLSQDSRQFREQQGRDQEAPMRVLSPLSESEADEIEDLPEEEFVDAQDSHYDGQAVSQGRGASGHINFDGPPPAVSPSDKKWRRSIEQALVKMTAEVAALREQLESRRIFGYRRSHSFVGWLAWLAWSGLKFIAIDVLVLAAVLWWLRRKKDRRLENAIRVLLGDAVVQVQKSGAQIAHMGKITLPKMPAKKSS